MGCATQKWIRRVNPNQHRALISLCTTGHSPHKTPKQVPSLYDVKGKAEVSPSAQESLRSRAERVARMDTAHSPSIKTTARNRSRPSQAPTGIPLRPRRPQEVKLPSLLQYLPEELGALSKSIACCTHQATAIGDPGESPFQADAGLLPLKADGRDTHPQANSF